MIHIKSRQAVLGAALLLLTGWSQDSDVLSEQPMLKEAVAEYQAAVKMAGDKMVPGFDKLIELTRKNKAASADEIVSAIAELERQREVFQKHGTIPDISYLERYAKVYQRSVDVAESKLNVPFRKVIKALIDEGKDAEAAAILKFRDELVTGEGYELVGRWQLVEGVAVHGFSEVYEIQKSGGRWSVERSFYTPTGTKAGASSGKGFVFLDGALSYTDYFVKKPRSEWHDKADFTIKVDEETPGRLTLRWVVSSGQSDRITLVPVK